MKKKIETYRGFDIYKHDGCFEIYKGPLLVKQFPEYFRNLQAVRARIDVIIVNNRDK